jgi:hypothetical protein
MVPVFSLLFHGYYRVEEWSIAMRLSDGVRRFIKFHEHGGPRFEAKIPAGLDELLRGGQMVA